MELVIQALSGIFLLLGAFFMLASGIGVIRLPDVFTRLHAAGMKDTMGSALTLVGLMFLAGFSLVSVKLILIWALLWFTCSVATHAVARAAFLSGLRPVLAEGVDHPFDRAAGPVGEDADEVAREVGEAEARELAESRARAEARESERRPEDGDAEDSRPGDGGTE